MAERTGRQEENARGNERLTNIVTIFNCLKKVLTFRRGKNSVLEKKLKWLNHVKVN
jgi:hypothetical protein